MKFPEFKDIPDLDVEDIYQKTCSRRPTDAVTVLETDDLKINVTIGEDESPDTSWIGKYTSKLSDFSGPYPNRDRYSYEYFEVEYWPIKEKIEKLRVKYADKPKTRRLFELLKNKLVEEAEKYMRDSVFLDVLVEIEMKVKNGEAVRWETIGTGSLGGIHFLQTMKGVDWGYVKDELEQVYDEAVGWAKATLEKAKEAA